MKKWVVCLLLALAVLPGCALAAEVPEDLRDALPREVTELLDGTDYSGETGFSSGVSAITARVSAQLQNILRERVRGAAAVLLIVLLCGVIDGVRPKGGAPGPDLMPMAGALSVTMASAGSLDSLIGLGAGTMDTMSVFSKALLPTLAAAAASAGAMGTATVQQVSAVFFADLLLQLIHSLLLPMTYLYIGMLTAGAMLSDSRLSSVAAALKKVIAFTGYLSVVRVITGSVDGAAVKAAKAAISGAVPVVGSILSDAAETVLAGACLLKNTIGVFGMLAVLAICAIPFLQLGIQYLLYKLAAFLSGMIGPPELCRLVDGLAGAFGLVLGMTGACALLLLISILSSIAAVVP